MMEDEAKRRLKSADLQAKKDRLRMWTNYVPPQTNSKAIHDQNFTGKVYAIPFWNKYLPSILMHQCMYIGQMSEFSFACGFHL